MVHSHTVLGCDGMKLAALVTQCVNASIEINWVTSAAHPIPAQRVCECTVKMLTHCVYFVKHSLSSWCTVASGLGFWTTTCTVYCRDWYWHQRVYWTAVKSLWMVVVWMVKCFRISDVSACRCTKALSKLLTEHSKSGQNCVKQCVFSAYVPEGLRGLSNVALSITYWLLLGIIYTGHYTAN